MTKLKIDISIFITKNKIMRNLIIQNPQNITNKIIDFAKIFVIINIALLLESCSSSEPYPQNWDSINDSKKYGDTTVNGTYSAYGNSSTRNNLYTIADLIDLPHLENIGNFDNFSVVLKNKNSLTIILRLQSETIYKTVFPENGYALDFNEDGPQLNLHIQKSGDTGIILTISDNGDVTLMKCGDGSLIVRTHSYGFGFMIMIPIFGSATHWFKFDKY